MADEIPEQIRLKDIRKTGFDSVILHYTSLGISPGEIEGIIREDYNVRIAAENIGRWLTRFGDANDFVRAQDARVLMERRKEAREVRNHFKAKYFEAEREDDEKKMQFYSREFKDWWDREGKLFLSTQEIPVVFQQNNEFSQTVNSLSIVVDELKDDPEAARRVLDRLEQG